MASKQPTKSTPSKKVVEEKPKSTPSSAHHPSSTTKSNAAKSQTSTSASASTTAAMIPLDSPSTIAALDSALPLPLSTSSTSLSSITPISSPHDPHLYRHITLPNGLCAMLIVDAPKTQEQRAREEAKKKKTAKKAASSAGNDDAAVDEDESKPAVVALSVKVGHWSDPEAIPGLAHFCEHMLFMGNKSYPSENEWEEYLSDHGGASNAFTDSEFTCYYYEINPLYLHPALQRFAQFFISPLFAASATKREIRAVDSEFRDCYHSDSERMSELLNTTAALVNPHHPFGKFGWGNLESLETNLKPKKQEPKGKATNGKKGKGAPTSSTSTATPAVDLRAELKAFHARYYSAHAMKLIVYHAGGKLDKLEKWIHTEFEAIVNNHLPLNDFASFGHPFLPPTATQIIKSKGTTSPALTTCLQHIFYVVPIKEIYKLNLSWVITPSLHQYYAKKPLHYAEHLLGHESAGSLYSLLRSKGWITSLVAGVNESGNYQNSAFECLQLTLSLTKDGSKVIYDILDLVFQYLALIRREENIHESIYNELKSLSEIGFLFEEAGDPSDMVQDLAINAQIYPPQDMIRGEFLHTGFDRALTKSVLDRLSVQNCRVDFCTPANKERVNLKTAPWFHTKYDFEPIDPVHLTKWTRYDLHPELIDSALHLPTANIFIPTDFSINAQVSAEDAQKQAENANGPQLLCETKFGQYWWQLDEVFKLPRGHIHLLLETPTIYSSPTTVALNELLIKLWVDSVNEYAYQASLAELEFSIDSLRSGIELKFSGFHHKLLSFIEKILQGLSDLESFLLKPENKSRFESMKEKTTRHFMHLYFIPLKQANHARLSLLQQQKFPVEEVTEASKAITQAQLIDHVRQLLASIRIIGLVDGNIPKADAAIMFQHLESILCTTTTPAPSRVERTFALPAGHVVYLDQRARNRKETNHAIEVYFQIGPATIFTRSILNLLEAMIAEPGFDQLRTKEQLGYKVQSGIRNTHGVLGFVICIQSAAYDPKHLASRVESFLWTTFYTLLLSMSAEKFETQRSSLISEFLYEDTHLGERVDRNWEEITETRSYVFGRPAIMAKQVAQVTHQQVIQFYEHYFLGIIGSPPQPETNSSIMDDIPTPSASPASSISSSASPLPDEDTTMATAAVAVSSIQLNPAEQEAKFKEERKAAKKLRLAEAKAKKEAQIQSSITTNQIKDPVAEAAIVAKVSGAKLQPVLYRRQLVVCIHGHAHKKRDGSAEKKVSKDSAEDEDEDMGGGSEEDDGSEEDGEDGSEEEGSGSEGDEGGEVEADGSGSDSDEDDSSTPSIDSLWWTESEWRDRLAEQQAKELENASMAAVQPPTKKQKNGHNKQTLKHDTAPAITTAVTSSASTAIFTNFPSPPRVPIQFHDGLSLTCPCGSSGSTTSSSTTSTATVTASYQLEHVIRVRTYAALQELKSQVEFLPDYNGPEPDLPANAMAIRR